MKRNENKLKAALPFLGILTFVALCLFGYLYLTLPVPIPVYLTWLVLCEIVSLLFIYTRRKGWHLASYLLLIILIEGERQVVAWWLSAGFEKQHWGMIHSQCMALFALVLVANITSFHQLPLLPDEPIQTEISE